MKRESGLTEEELEILNSAMELFGDRSRFFGLIRNRGVVSKLNDLASKFGGNLNQLDEKLNVFNSHLTNLDLVTEQFSEDLVRIRGDLVQGVYNDLRSRLIGDGGLGQELIERIRDELPRR